MVRFTVKSDLSILIFERKLTFLWCIALVIVLAGCDANQAIQSDTARSHEVEIQSVKNLDLKKFDPSTVSGVIVNAADRILEGPNPSASSVRCYVQKNLSC